MFINHKVRVSEMILFSEYQVSLLVSFPIAEKNNKNLTPAGKTLKEGEFYLAYGLKVFISWLVSSKTKTLLEEEFCLAHGDWKQIRGMVPERKRLGAR